METVIRRRRKRSPRRAAALVLAALAAAAAGIGVNAALRKPVTVTAREYVADAVSAAFAEAVGTTLAEGDYDLLSVERTGEESYIITADTAKLNRLAVLAVNASRGLISELGAEGISVDLGTASGIALLSGAGPCVSVGFTPLGSVEARPVSSLRSAGINQSLFSLSLELTANVRLIAAGAYELVTVKALVPVAETVVVGRVPQVYTNVANEEDMLNLIPTDVP